MAPENSAQTQSTQVFVKKETFCLSECLFTAPAADTVVASDRFEHKNLVGRATKRVPK
jgi:hypothetical protein